MHTIFKRSNPTGNDLQTFADPFRKVSKPRQYYLSIVEKQFKPCGVILWFFRSSIRWRPTISYSSAGQSWFWRVTRSGGRM